VVRLSKTAAPAGAEADSRADFAETAETALPYAERPSARQAG
jgi:hypothetical protein